MAVILFHVLCLRSRCSNMSSRSVDITASALGNTARLGFLTGRLPLDWGSVRCGDGRAFTVSLSSRTPSKHLQGLVACFSACLLFFRDLHNQSLSGSLPDSWSALFQVSSPQIRIQFVVSVTNCLQMAVVKQPINLQVSDYSLQTVSCLITAAI